METEAWACRVKEQSFGMLFFYIYIKTLRLERMRKGELGLTGIGLKSADTSRKFLKSLVLCTYWLNLMLKVGILFSGENLSLFHDFLQPYTSKVEVFGLAFLG